MLCPKELTNFSNSFALITIPFKVRIHNICMSYPRISLIFQKVFLKHFNTVVREVCKSSDAVKAWNNDICNAFAGATLTFTCFVTKMSAKIAKRHIIILLQSWNSVLFEHYCNQRKLILQVMHNHDHRNTLPNSTIWCSITNIVPTNNWELLYLWLLFTIL